ncbi:MAG: hypothetical protein AAFY71_28700, partial [Bacteroidota bacterium]
MKRLIFICSSFFLIVLLLTACNGSRLIRNTLKNDLDIQASIPKHLVPQSAPDFKGLREFVKKNETVNILFIPGPTAKDWTFYLNTIKSLTDRLEFELDSFSTAYISKGTNDTIPVGKGEVWEWNFIEKTKRQNENPRKRINFFYLNWTSITEPVKDSFRNFQLQNLDLKEPLKTTYLSGKTRNRYLVDMVGSLPLYRQPDYHREIIRTSFEAFKIIKDKGDDIPLISITSSTGNQLLMDTFEAMLIESG